MDIMKVLNVLKYYVYIYIVLFASCLMLLAPIDRKLYIHSMQHLDYFFWHLCKIDNPYSFLCMGLWFYLYVNYFPIISFLLPNWDEWFDLHGCLYCIPVALSKDKELPYKMQSKLFWYHCFTDHHIKTPIIYFHIIDGKLQPVHTMKNLNQDATFILKPNYGTQGRNIRKIQGEEITRMQTDLLTLYRYNDKLIQEYVSDCFVDTARHFRINTVSHPTFQVFSIDERKQSNQQKIASNHAAGADVTFCQNNHCDFLSQRENDYIREICRQLLDLHRKEFGVVPLIGWDVCLTCDGPYVFEGNLGADIEPYNYKEYMKMVHEIYHHSL